MKASPQKSRLMVSSVIFAIFSLIFFRAPLVFADDASASSTPASTTADRQIGSGITGSGNIQGGMIAFQGDLNDASGTPVSDGLYNIDFKIYDAPTNGNAQWEESFTGDQRIQVTGGKFSVSLGETTPLDLDFNNNSYYLAVTVGNTGDSPVWDKEMTPRKEIVTVEQLLAQAKIDGKSALDEFIKALDSGNNMVVIVDSATMASLLAQLEQQSAGQSSSAGNGGGILSQLAGFFVSVFETIQSDLASIGRGVAQALSLLTDISQKVDQIYQAVVVNGKMPMSASILSSVSPANNDVASQQSGTAVVLANEESVNIATTAIQNDSNVLVTSANGSGGGSAAQDNWTISNRVAGEYFTVTFDQPVPSDTIINWWVLNTDSPAGSAASSTTGAMTQTTTPAMGDQSGTDVASSPAASGATTPTDIVSPPAASSTSDDMVDQPSSTVAAPDAPSGGSDATDDGSQSSSTAPSLISQ